MCIRDRVKALIELAKSGFVDIAAVGNEVLLRNDMSEHELLGYIERVKEAIPGVPVGYVDAYFQFHERPNLVEACDLVLANCYPFWEGCEIGQASLYLRHMYQATLQVARGKPVIITETGWPNQGSSVNSAEPAPVNAMKYFINTIRWQQENEIDLFYFSSFDESWKVHHEGDVGERWGIWDKNEKLKYI
jgi:GPH family glycoside/pentoside/hexuronide:cation symporter